MLAAFTDNLTHCLLIILRKCHCLSALMWELQEFLVVGCLLLEHLLGTGNWRLFTLPPLLFADQRRLEGFSWLNGSSCRALHCCSVHRSTVNYALLQHSCSPKLRRPLVLQGLKSRFLVARPFSTCLKAVTEVHQHFLPISLLVLLWALVVGPYLILVESVECVCRVLGANMIFPEFSWLSGGRIHAFIVLFRKHAPFSSDRRLSPIGL